MQGFTQVHAADGHFSENLLLLIVCNLCTDIQFKGYQVSHRCENQGYMYSNLMAAGLC